MTIPTDSAQIEKRNYINEQMLRSTYQWVSVSAFCGAIFFLIFTLVDYFVSPENFKFFFLLRCFMAIFLFAISFLNMTINRKKIKKIALNLLVLAAAVGASATIEIMILKLGGVRSPYYAGLILVVIFALGFLPIDFVFSIIAVGLIYFIYLLPIIIKGGIDDYPAFINNNTFLVSAMAIAIIWRYLSYKNLENMLGLQYELDQSKKKLETYSTQLEHLVEERTKELNKSNLMFRSLFQHAQDGILIMDKTGRILDVNQALCEIHGFDPKSLIGANIVLLETHEDDGLFRERMERIMKGEPILYETRHYRKDGSKVSLEVSSKVIEIDGHRYIQSFYRDITEKKKMQAQLVHSQKMESIGQLAGGIAHDFNNILTSILGFTELILLKDDIEESIAGKVRTIEKVSRQAVQMVSKLLSFARRGYFEPVPFSIDKAIEDTLEMMSRLVPKEITLIKGLSVPNAVVEGDVSMLEQVFMNLVINAKDAMPDGGTLTVGTSVVELGPSDLDIGADVQRGKYVNILVRDTGKGIPENDRLHIFEPLFTTKEKGKGTGLGLAMVYGIVKEHKGYITVKSKPGRGSDFDVYIPLCAKKSHLEKPDKSDVTGSETILAIDDEAPVLEFIKETLKGRGFRVMTAEDPLHGLDMYKNNSGGINLVITDMAMPVMGGGQLISNIKTINPRARIIAVTGYNEYEGDGNIDILLRKPFTGSKLLTTVREVLDRPN